MSLPLLSLDVIGIITYLLDGDDVFRLKLAGSRLLWTKIEASCTALFCFVRPTLAFPFSAFSLPRLAHLSVSVPLGYASSPLRLHHRLPLPSRPLGGVQSIRFNFSQSLSVLSLVDASPALSSAFPNLTRLKITGSHAFITPDNLRALPRTLKSFSAKNRQQYTATISYLDVLPNLPRHLERLSLKEIRIQPNEQSKTYEGAEWPKSLTRLKIDRFDSRSFLSHLPVAIEEIKCSFMPATTPIEPIRTSQLPRTLRKLVLKSLFIVWPYIIHDGDLPPNLVVHDLGIENTQHENSTEELPRSLEVYRFSDESLRAQNDWDVKFPSLTSIGDDRVLTAEDVPYLPKSLKNLNIEGDVSLTDPSSEPYPWKYLKDLNITSLEAPVVSVEQAMSLPSCLTSLSICPSPLIVTPGTDASVSSSTNSDSDESFCQLEKQTFSFLPSSLASLSFNLELLPSLDCFALLPPSLTKLLFHARNESWNNLANDVSLFQHFPVLPLLDSLHILDVDYAGAWRVWLRDLYDDDGRRTPQLKSLVVSMGNTEGAVLHDPSNSHLLYLPKTLKSRHSQQLRAWSTTSKSCRNFLPAFTPLNSTLGT